jgi:putative ABC transport system ATP-binding protein
VSARYDGSHTPDRWGAAVRLTGVYKVFRVGDTGIAALAGVDLVIEPGEFVALVGPSGSGKSSALHLMGGLDRASAGVVEVEGDDLGLLDSASLTRHRADRVGFVWQGAARNLVPYLTAIDNVRLPRKAPRRTTHLRRGATASTTPEELLDLVGLADRAHHTPPELSGGEQQRTAIAVALANDPSLLLADEPTAELDGVSAANVLDVFRGVADRLGTTIVMSTHDLLAARTADRLVYMRHGRAVEAGIPMPPLEEDGIARLPLEVADTLGEDALEVTIGRDDIVIRRRRGVAPGD